jgi:chromosome segregation ATPase
LPAATETTDNLTPQQTIAILLADLRELRNLLEKTKAERDAAVTAYDSEKAERESFERSYASAEKQIATLNRSIEHVEKAIALHEKTIAMVEKQRDEAKAEAKRSRKNAVVSTLILGGVLAAKFFGIF